MCDADRWLLGATTGGELPSDSAAVGEIAVGAGAVIATKLPNQDLYSPKHNIPGCSLSQCSWLLNEEYLPVTLTLLIIIKWICLSVFCQFYRFLARFSGRRRDSTSSTHPPPHLHPHLEHHQHNPHVDHERHLETESSESSTSTSSVPLLRLSPPRCRVLSSSPSCGVVTRSSCHPSSAAHRMRPCHSYFLATLLLVASTFLGVTDACSSRSTPKPRSPSPTARPNVTFHTYKCPPAYATWYCLNGATCFTVKIGESLLYNCECADGYMGQRCEFKDLDGSYLPSRQKVMLEKASIAGGATIATILVVVVFMAIFIQRQRRRKEMRTSSVDGPSPHDVERRPFSRYPPPHFHMDSVVAHSTAPSRTSIGGVNVERASGMTAPPPMVLLPPSCVHKQEA